MKKIYYSFLVGALSLTSATSFAQNPQQAPGVTIYPGGAGPGDEITMVINVNKICTPDGKDSLFGKAEAGFHSGYIVDSLTPWQGVIEYNAATAISLTNTSDSTFEVTFTPATYYGVDPSGMIGFSFVLNGGVNNGGWDLIEGKAYNDNGECSDFFVYLPYDGPNGIESIGEISNFSVMPNPASSETRFTFTTQATEKVSLKLYSLLGAEVATVIDGTLAAGTYNETVKLDNLSNGVYMYVLRSGNSVTQGKIVKQ